MSKPILLIDDEEKFARMLQELLHHHGFESEYCLSPAKALVRMQSETYDLIISDYKMPEMDGAEFLEKARKMNPDLPVIMISGLMNMPELIKVANIGVTLVLEKPFQTEDLVEQVGRFVRSEPQKAASSEAMDMEASEINFQLGYVPVTYPTPAQFLSDSSNENKRFLESLWKQANVCRHLPFYAQRGAEVRLVAKEIMDWTDQDPEAEVVRIDLLDTMTEFTLTWVQEADPFPGVLVIDLRDAEWDEKTPVRLAEWINFVEESGKDLSLSRLLYILPMGAPFKPEELEVSEAARKLISTDAPVLLSLRERVQDTATYISRFLDHSEHEALGPAKIKQLLHYSWPGGYKELQSRLNAIRLALKEQEVLTDAIFREILAERSDDTLSLNGNLDLEGYLKRRQREYIYMNREAGEQLTDTLLRLGVELKTVPPESIENELALVYPAVVAEQDT